MILTGDIQYMIWLEMFFFLKVMPFAQRTQGFIQVGNMYIRYAIWMEKICIEAGDSKLLFVLPHKADHGPFKVDQLVCI
jgi:hypothetical protein